MFERLKCWLFGHAWIYSEQAVFINNYNSRKTNDFTKRKCNRCPAIEKCLYKSNISGDKWRRVE